MTALHRHQQLGTKNQTTYCFLAQGRCVANLSAERTGARANIDSVRPRTRPGRWMTALPRHQQLGTKNQTTYCLLAQLRCVANLSAERTSARANIDSVRPRTRPGGWVTALSRHPQLGTYNQ